MTSGTSATRCSPSPVSLGTPTFIRPWNLAESHTDHGSEPGLPDREWLPREARQRLRGDPDGRLHARARVADRPRAHLQRADVCQGRAGATAPDAVGVAAGGDEALD